MAYPSTDLSEEAILSSFFGVKTVGEAEAMEREAEQMLAEIRAFHIKTRETNEDTERISNETRAILQRLKSDLRLS